MTQIVSNPSADREEKIEHAAKILRDSEQAKAVFELVYRGPKQFKTIDDMRKKLGADFNENTYRAANRLAAENILEKNTHNGRDAYYKIGFYTHNRDRILRLSKNPKRLKKYPTKRKVSLSGGESTLTFRTNPQAKQIFIDDIDSFERIRLVKKGDISLVKGFEERKINRGISRILGQPDKKDWGGERNDIFSTSVKFAGKRIASAFALKGKGTKGALTPKKMGKNGDQISRLFEGTAEVHFVVYNDTVEESIHDSMQAHAISKALGREKTIYFCIVDGSDLARLVGAYPENFADE